MQTCLSIRWFQKGSINCTINRKVLCLLDICNVLTPTVYFLWLDCSITEARPIIFHTSSSVNKGYYRIMSRGVTMKVRSLQITDILDRFENIKSNYIVLILCCCCLCWLFSEFHMLCFCSCTHVVGRIHVTVNNQYTMNKKMLSLS